MSPATERVMRDDVIRAAVRGMLDTADDFFIVLAKWLAAADTDPADAYTVASAYLRNRDRLRKKLS